jgi:hypothetical protein
MMLCPTESGAAEPDVPSDLRTLHTQYILPALMEEERRAVPSLAAFFSRIVNVRALIIVTHDYWVAVPRQLHAQRLNRARAPAI